MHSQYATVISTQLNNTFLDIKRRDFLNPVGFSRIERASGAVKNYFALRTLLENSIKKDVSEQTNRDLQVHVFRRWISVAQLLLKRNHYEGCCLVALALLQLDTRYRISKDLPQYSNDVFEAFSKLLSPQQNFKLLRDCIKSSAQQNSSVLLPFFLLSRDITFINEALGENQNKSFTDLNEEDPSYDLLTQREQLLTSFTQAKPKTKVGLSEHLQSLFDTITNDAFSFNDHDEVEADNLQTTQVPTSTLYSRELRPTFWSRKGGVDNHWKKIFQVAKLPEMLT